MKNQIIKKAWLRWIAERSEALMFSLAVAYLACLAVLVVLWVDVPGLETRSQLFDKDSERVEMLAGSFDDNSLRVIEHLETLVLVTMGLVWIVVIGEAIWHVLTRAPDRTNKHYHIASLVFCCCPFLRMCARSPEMRDRIWLPGLGWRRGGASLQRQLERSFSVPMMIVALLIMPILITEFFLKDQVAVYLWLRVLLHIGTGVIWFAFALEFVLMVSIAEKKIDYCKHHWIDLAIILLPLVAFLRSLSLARTLRLTNVMRVQQLSNLARAYRLRGTAIKAFRVLILFDLTERLFNLNKEKRLAKMQTQLRELEKQTRMLRHRMARLKRQIGEDSEAVNPTDQTPQPKHASQSFTTTPTVTADE